MLSRPDLENETMFFDGREYKLLSQIDYIFGGTTALGQELFGSESILTVNDFTRLYQNAQSREALDALYRKNISLINTIAHDVHDYCLMNNIPCLPLGDLISEGFFGLEWAARRFDDSRGAKFSTYAFDCIRGAMLNANKDWRRHNVMPEDALYPSFIKPDEYSLDLMPAGVLDPAESALRNITLGEVSSALKRLPKRHRDIFRMRYEKEMTQKEVGDALKISGGRVGQIEKEGISLLKTIMQTDDE